MLIPPELLLQFLIFILSSRILSGKRSLAWLWLKRVVYLIPPKTDEVIYLESNPGAVTSWLKKQGFRAMPRSAGQEKDRIQLLTAGIDDESVLISEDKVVPTKRPLGTHPASGVAEIRHKAVPADLANVWKSLIDLTVATMGSYVLITALRYFLPSMVFFAPTPRGTALIIAGMCGMPLYAMLTLLWRRNSASNDWKVSWVVAGAFLLVLYIVLSPSVNSSAGTPEFWNLGITNSFKDIIDAVSDLMVQLGGQGLLLKSASTNADPAASQHRLKELFSSETGASNTEGLAVDPNAWLSGYHPTVANNLWIFQILVTVCALPVGLGIHCGVNRQVKSIFQSRGNMRTSALVTMVRYFNLLAMPLFVCLFWSPFLSSFIISSGFYFETSKILAFRRAASFAFVALQLLLVRSSVQVHLDTGKDITEMFLSLSATTPNRGLSIQANLRALAKATYVVALEAASSPLLHLGLLFTNHWLTNSIYLASILVSWPIALLLIFVQTRR